MAAAVSYILEVNENQTDHWSFTAGLVVSTRVSTVFFFFLDHLGLVVNYFGSWTTPLMFATSIGAIREAFTWLHGITSTRFLPMDVESAGLLT